MTKHDDAEHRGFYKNVGNSWLRKQRGGRSKMEPDLFEDEM